MSATLGQLIDVSVARLRDTSPTARVDAEALALHVFGLSRAALMASANTAPAPVQIEQFLSLVERRHGGEPIAYLIGRREFWSLDLAVSPATLIPRPETELLVEQALMHIPVEATSTVLDLGTGSGAIALAIASERPCARIVATDCSLDALGIAQTNAAHLGLRNIEFRHGDWFAPLAGLMADVIVSNPPYVAASDPHLACGDVRFEPRAALAGGADGLDAIRHIATTAPGYLRDGGRLLFEHGADQSESVRALLERRKYHHIQAYLDLAGHARVTAAARP